MKCATAEGLQARREASVSLIQFTITEEENSSR